MMSKIAQRAILILVLPMLTLGVMAGIAGCVSRDDVAAMPGWDRYFPSAALREVTSPSARQQRIRLYAVEGESGTMGYYGIQQAASRSSTFKVIVIMGPDFRVLNACAAEYTGQRGQEVRSEQFTQQFQNKTSVDPIRVGEDIDAVTGATSSSRAMAGGVRQIVRLAKRELNR